MATERLHLLRRLAVLPVLVALPAWVLLGAPVTADASSAWWEPVAFAGQRVNEVSVSGGLLFVVTPSGLYSSSDHGATFQRRGPSAHVAFGPPPDEPVRWEVRDGTVLTAPSGHPTLPDPRSPFLGDSAYLIAAPAAAPGVAVAVGSDNHVWRRAASGEWATSLILLPAGGLAGIPRVTSLAAFSQPLSASVYMGTAGYGVLLSRDGGDDWIRADPGLPANVLGLAADSSTKALYAATDQGLFVHHLQALPRPPTYMDSQLVQRWLGIALVALATTIAAHFGLRRTLPSTDHLR